MGRRVVGLVISSAYISCVVGLEGELSLSLCQSCCKVGRRVVGIVVSSVYVSCVVRMGGELLALLSLQFMSVVL